MKTIVLVLMFNIAGLVLEAQVNKQRQMQREEDKVMVFSSEERANLQLWFYEQTQKMGLSEEVNAEYERIFYDHIYEMSRLNDKDQDFTDDEMHQRFDAIVDKLNMEMRQLLNQEQYIQHLENFGEIVRSIYARMNWTN